MKKPLQERIKHIFANEALLDLNFDRKLQISFSFMKRKVQARFLRRRVFMVGGLIETSRWTLRNVTYVISTSSRQPRKWLPIRFSIYIVLNSAVVIVEQFARRVLIKN